MIENTVIFLIVSIGIIDIILATCKLRTISNLYQALFPTWVDVILMAGAATGLYFLPISKVPYTILLIVCGHLFWPNKERHV